MIKCFSTKDCYLTMGSNQKPHQHHRLADIHFQCTLATKGVWHLCCSEQHGGSDLIDHRPRFENDLICKLAVAMLKQQPIADRYVIVFPQHEKFLANITSF